MKKIKLSEIKKDKKYRLSINTKEPAEFNTKSQDSSFVIQFLKRYYNMGDMICDGEIKDEKEFLEYLQNRKSPGCDNIELFEI